MIKTAAALAAVLLLAADEPFNGKDLAGWKLKGKAEKGKWKVGKAALDAADPRRIACGEGGSDLVNDADGKGVDLYSEAKWGDALVEVEVFVPKGSNSGIYLMGEYEVQILDSHGKAADKMGMGDMGAIYSAAVPRLNASKAPGEWQKYAIDFRAPRFDEAGKKTANAKFVKVTLNDQVIHENVEVKGSTGGGLTQKEAATGPLLFQGDHGPVAFRNIKVTPVK